MLRRASMVAGERLVGVLAFGSWARGELADGSDVDVLVVVEPDLPVTRELYRRWDAEPPSWDGRAVEPHFVHPPSPAGRIGGLWAEASLDGIVLFERERLLSRALAGVRGRVARGEIVRREAGGQPYWVEAV